MKNKYVLDSCVVSLLFLFLLPLLSASAMPFPRLNPLKARTFASAFEDPEMIVGVFQLVNEQCFEYWHTEKKDEELYGFYQLEYDHDIVPLICLERLKGDIPDYLFFQVGSAVRISLNGEEVNMFWKLPRSQWLLALEHTDGSTLLPDYLELPFESMAPLPCDGIKTNVYRLPGDRTGSVLVFDTSCSQNLYPVRIHDGWKDSAIVRDFIAASHAWQNMKQHDSTILGDPFDNVSPTTNLGKLFLEELRKRGTFLDSYP